MLGSSHPTVTHLNSNGFARALSDTHLYRPLVIVAGNGPCWPMVSKFKTCAHHRDLDDFQALT